jgi:hypothetical protein
MGWVSAAAAAGLFVGLGLGTVYYSQTPGDDQQAVIGTTIAAPADAAAVNAVESASVLVPALVGDVSEQFLSELELALERPHTPELLALDELTPRVREVRFQLR